MSETVRAVYDGSDVLRLDKSLPLPPNSRVIVTVQLVEEKRSTPYSFLDVALSLKLEGPADMSENLDKYLYGDGNRS
jgi:hypothetical protein